MSSTVDGLFELLSHAGSIQYGGEKISQLEHALQCAYLAEAEHAPGPLIAAALLHDIGHLVGHGDEGFADKGIDARHEESGARFLSQWFGDQVCAPIRLHVDAKRYLCRGDPEYLKTLSPASVRSLGVQGGIYDAEGAAAFLRTPFADAGIQLRSWDDMAKRAAATTPGLEHFRPYLEAELV
ncbi:MAG: HD domain-containing protein [Alphaproteobacteria bacterium]|nr:HD domain-containing protein [Alphaproteobacteria bacterium]